MPAIAYTVTATLPDEESCLAYIEWLEDGHLDAVIKGGAHSASIIRLHTPGENDRPQVETRYIFSTREVFDHYVREIAPTLRADGLKRFGPERGVMITRRTGTVL